MGLQIEWMEELYWCLRLRFPIVYCTLRNLPPPPPVSTTVPSMEVTATDQATADSRKRDVYKAYYRMHRPTVLIVISYDG